jgi:hypothetical protein
MRIVNETGVEVFYGISYPGAGDCGTIDVDGYVDLPAYDNQPVVYVSIKPSGAEGYFSINIPSTGTDEQVEMACLAE